MRCVTALVGLMFFGWCAAFGQSTGIQTNPEAPNWCSFARQYLTGNKQPAYDCQAEANRCIRMNNYSCTKNFSSKGYEGELVDSSGKAITDVDHHVLYEDPKWSIRKSIDILHSYYMQKGRTSALAMAETWAPWCDTNGSKLIHLGWGRTCKDGPGVVPASFVGPRCKRPAKGIPLKGQCGPCNCPNEIASFWAKDTGIDISSDLNIFDGNGNPTAMLNPVLKRVVWMELGHQPTQIFIDKAIAVYAK